MAPDKNWMDDFSIPTFIMMAAKDVYNGGVKVVNRTNHKWITVAMGAILTALLYWGFNRTFTQVDNIEKRQIEVIKNQGEMKLDIARGQFDLKNQFTEGLLVIKSELGKVEQRVEDHISQTEQLHKNGKK